MSACVRVCMYVCISVLPSRTVQGWRMYSVWRGQGKITLLLFWFLSLNCFREQNETSNKQQNLPCGRSNWQVVSQPKRVATQARVLQELCVQSFSLPGSSAGAGAMTDAAVEANVLSNDLPRSTGYFCTNTCKTHLFMCLEKSCARSWCGCGAAGLTWEALVASVRASVRCFLPLAAWVMCCLFPHWNKSHYFRSRSYQTL